MIFRSSFSGTSKLTGVILFTGLLLLVSCSQPPPQKTQYETASESQVPAHKSGYLTDYGETRLDALAYKLKRRDQITHILQLGDSHTAADFFTDALRAALQQRYGDAGPGWLPPAEIRGQRSAGLKLDQTSAKAWQLTNSRVAKHPNFPLGGFILQPLQSGSSVQLAQYRSDATRFSVRALYQAPYRIPLFINGNFMAWDANSNWQWSPEHHLQLPLKLRVLDANYPQLGGWFVKNGKPGVLFSSLGVNGATINMLDKWGDSWRAPLQALQPDLIILAYGTNEAFNDYLDSDAYHATLTRHIQLLRWQLPQTALLILSAPGAIKNHVATSCQGQRPMQLDAVQAIQRQVAREQKTVFWDWQAMIGGTCGFADWQTKGLSKKDGVHFTNEGYKISADIFYQDFKKLIENRK